MTSLKVWSAVTVSSAVIGASAGATAALDAQTNVLTGDSLVPLGLAVGGIWGVAVGTWKLSQAVGNLATKADIKGLRLELDKRLEVYHKRIERLEALNHDE